MGLGFLELMVSCGFLLGLVVVAAVVIVLVKRGGSAGIAQTPTVPAGWYPDSTGGHELRYWDGSQWTSSVSDAGVQSVDGVEGTRE